MNIGDVYEVVNHSWTDFGSLYSIYHINEEERWVDMLLVFDNDPAQDNSLIVTGFPMAWLNESDSWLKVDSMV